MVTPPAGFTSLAETYRNVEIYYNPDDLRYWCQPKAGYIAFPYTLSEAKAYIDEILGVTPPPTVVEPKQFIETYRGVNIYYIAYFNSYSAQTAELYSAVGATLPLIRAEIDKLLGPVPMDYLAETYRGVNIWWVVSLGMYRATVAAGKTAVGLTLLKVKEGIDEILAYTPPPVTPPTAEDYLAETYRGVEIWWIVSSQRYRSEPKAGYRAYSTTLAGAKAYIDSILGPAPTIPLLVFTCPMCPAKFGTQADLEAHIAAVHPASSWPWPLNAVQDWFDNLWNNVILAPINAFNTFWTLHIEPGLTWVKDQLMIGVNWVYNQLSPIINNIKTSIDRMRTLLDDTFYPMIDGMVKSLYNMRDDLIRITNEAIADIMNTAGNIQKYLGTAANDIINALTITSGANAVWLWSQSEHAFNTQNLAVTTGLGSVLTLMDESRNATHGDIDNSTTFLGGAINLGFSGALNTIGSWLDGVLKGVAGAFGTGLSGFFDGVLKSLGWIAEMIFGAIGFVRAKLKELITPILTGFLDAMTGGMSSHSPPEEIKIASNVFAQTMWNKQMAIIDKAYHSEPTGQEIMESGISLTSDLIAAALGVVGLGLIVDVVHPLKALGFKTTTRELVYWSGIPSITAALAVTPTAIGILRPLQYFFNDRYKNMIPPVDDVIRFSLREVWIPERRPLLLQFYPPEPYQGLIAKQGYSQEFAEDYWAAHWVLPSIGQLNEMLYRGIITPEKWETEVRYNDLVPYSIPWLKKIIYSPYTRVDIRRMWDIGLVTDPELLENYKWLGYDDAHAQRMTLWTKAYIIAGDVRALYSKGWINEAGARQMLIDVGVPKERVDVFMMRVVKSGQAERMTAEKDLTKTDILRLFKLNLMSVNEAMGMLQDLGYDEEEANYLIKIQEYAPQLEMKELTMSQILKAYSNEVYLRDEAKGLLMEAGWTETAAETLLKLEDIKLKDAQTVKMMEKELTRTDIVKGIDKGIIDKDTGAGYLSYLGYSQWEINFIFALEEIA